MPGKTEIVTADGSLHVFKLGRGWKRHLQVRVRPSGADRWTVAHFPAGQERLEVTGLDPDATYDVQIRRQRAWERWRHAATEFTFVPRSRPLRVVITGSGRSGTKTLAHYLDGMRFVDDTPVIARHEPLSEWVVPALADGDFALPVLAQTGALHNVESAPYYSIFPDVVRADKVILVIRDGRRVVQSGLNRGWFVNVTDWNRIKPQYEGDQFEQACQLWRDTNLRAEAIAGSVFRLEDIVADPARLAAFCTAAGVVSDGRELPHSNQGGQPSTTFSEWTDQQRSRFTEICGPLMDRYYTGWNAD